MYSTAVIHVLSTYLPIETVGKQKYTNIMLIISVLLCSILKNLVGVLTYHKNNIYIYIVLVISIGRYRHCFNDHRTVGNAIIHTTQYIMYYTFIRN